MAGINSAILHNVEILSLDDEDIIVTSPGDPNETPKWPIGGTSGGADPADPYSHI